MARVAKSIRVTGRVQGVFFRAWTSEQAEALGVDGWVRNCPDGSVEAHAEGDADAVDRLVDQMRSGPGGAQVAELSAEDSAVTGESGFRIRH